MSDKAEEPVELDSVSSEEEKQEAEKQGWSDKDSWRGDPDKWVSAREFLERGEKIVPIKMERKNREIERLNKQMEELQELIIQQQNMSVKARQDERKKVLAEIKAQQKQAVEDGDSEKFQQLEQKRESVEKEAASDTTPAPRPAKDPVFEAWKEENQWFEEDEKLQAFAVGISTTIQAKTGKKDRELYDAVKEEVKNTFPSHPAFGNPRRENASQVEGATQTTPKKTGKSFNDLPPEAKKAYEKFRKVFEDKGRKFTKEEYLANYVWE